VGLLGSTIVAAGGFSAGGETGDNEGYNVSTNSWTSLATEPVARNASCTGVIKGSLYVAGGDPGPANSDESFKATKNKWTTQASIPQAVVAPGSAVFDKVLFCFGGSNNGTPFEGTVYDNVQIYQP